MSCLQRNTNARIKQEHIIVCFKTCESSVNDKNSDVLFNKIFVLKQDLSVVSVLLIFYSKFVNNWHCNKRLQHKQKFFSFSILSICEVQSKNIFTEYAVICTFRDISKTPRSIRWHCHEQNSYPLFQRQKYNCLLPKSFIFPLPVMLNSVISGVNVSALSL